MEVKPITILVRPDGRPVCAGHFCTVVLHPPNNRGEMLCELTPTRQVAKKLRQPAGRYLVAGRPKNIDKPSGKSHTFGRRFFPGRFFYWASQHRGGRY